MEKLVKTQSYHLEVENLTKAFPGVVALDQVSLEFLPGQVNAVVGENGAGKSTLLKILSGVYQADEGTIRLNGKEVRFANTREAQDQGIAIIHQELKLIPYLSVSENIFLGREILNPYGLLDYPKMNAQTQAILEKLKLDVSPRTLVSELRVGQQQLVEIAKALLQKARILFLDEPTSAISDKEVDRLFALIRELKEQGVTLVYISHKMDELYQIADRLIALKDGKMMGSRPMEGTSQDDIIQLIVGRDIAKFSAERAEQAELEVLRLENWSMKHPDRPYDFAVRNVHLSLKAGEILGIFGLMGAGRTELLESVFGLHPRKITGKMFIEGKEVFLKSPGEAIRRGLAFVTEDRKKQGLVTLMNVRENISLTSLEQYEHLGLISEKEEGQRGQEYIEKLSIKTTGLQQRVENLSGGNQQKVVLAKWLLTDPKVLLLDEPTRGIDINAKNEIYHLINQLANEGKGIIVVSSELPEILALSDRIIVLSESRLTGVFTRDEATEALLMEKAIPQGKNE